MASIEMERASVATAASLQKRPSSLSLAFRLVRSLATKAAGATSLKSSAVGHPRSRFESDGVILASTADERLDVWVRHDNATTEAATAAVAASPAAVAASPAATQEEDETSPSPVPVRPASPPSLVQRAGVMTSSVFSLSSSVDNDQSRTAQSDEAEASDDIWIVDDPPIAWQMTI
jgi:hypothetical protein